MILKIVYYQKMHFFPGFHTCCANKTGVGQNVLVIYRDRFQFSILVHKEQVILFLINFGCGRPF